MSPEVSERTFEEAIEGGLLQHGPDACAEDTASVREVAPPYGDTPPGGYRMRFPRTTTVALSAAARSGGLHPGHAAKEWQKLAKHRGERLPSSS